MFVQWFVFIAFHVFYNRFVFVSSVSFLAGFHLSCNMVIMFECFFALIVIVFAMVFIVCVSFSSVFIICCFNGVERVGSNNYSCVFIVFIVLSFTVFQCFVHWCSLCCQCFVIGCHCLFNGFHCDPCVLIVFNKYCCTARAGGRALVTVLALGQLYCRR